MGFCAVPVCRLESRSRASRSRPAALLQHTTQHSAAHCTLSFQSCGNKNSFNSASFVIFLTIFRQMKHCCAFSSLCIFPSLSFILEITTLTQQCPSVSARNLCPRNLQLMLFLPSFWITLPTLFLHSNLCSSLFLLISTHHGHPALPVSLSPLYFCRISPPLRNFSLPLCSCFCWISLLSLPSLQPHLPFLPSLPRSCAPVLPVSLSPSPSLYFCRMSSAVTLTCSGTLSRRLWMLMSISRKVAMKSSGTTKRTTSIPRPKMSENKAPCTTRLIPNWSFPSNKDSNSTRDDTSERSVAENTGSISRRKHKHWSQMTPDVQKFDEVAERVKHLDALFHALHSSPRISILLASPSPPNRLVAFTTQELSSLTNLDLDLLDEVEDS